MIFNMFLQNCTSLFAPNYALTRANYPKHKFNNHPIIAIVNRKTIQPTSAIASSNAQEATQILSLTEDMASRFWPNYFLNYIPEDEETLSQREQEVNKLKEQIEKELLATISNKSMLEQLEVINNIQRLGLAYHFEKEIEEALNCIFKNHIYHQIEHDLDLCLASLMFRLLRQNGFYVSCDMFKKFLDKIGKFQESLKEDVEGMLSLYEASQLRTHGDDILDEAVTFTSTQLKLMINKLPHPLVENVAHALDIPLHKGSHCIEYRLYISLYEHNPCHNKLLLKFAKLNFNLLQSLYKKELHYLTRWCFHEGMDVYSALPCKVREQIANIHLSALTTYDGRPQYSLGRMIYFKICVMGIIIDDLYQECEIADLKLFTEAVQRWDKGCVNILSENMKAPYVKMLDTFEEVEQQLAKEGRSHAFHHAVEAFKIGWPLHLHIRIWYHDKYFPTFEEYMSTKETAGFKFLTLLAWLCIEEIAVQDALEWMQIYSKEIEALSSLFRLMDDIAEDYLNEAEEISVVSCYMNQHKMMNKAQVHEELQKIIDNVWKQLNYASLRPSNMPMALRQCFVNQARYFHVGYYRGDGFTFPDRTPMNKNLELLYKDPIPI